MALREILERLEVGLSTGGTVPPETKTAVMKQLALASAELADFEDDLRGTGEALSQAVGDLVKYRCIVTNMETRIATLERNLAESQKELAAAEDLLLVTSRNARRLEAELQTLETAMSRRR